MQQELILINFQEIRRRSIKLWNALPVAYYDWRPDEQAMTASEMVRHVLEADYGWRMIVLGEDMANYQTPWKGKPFMGVEEELKFAEPYRQAFLSAVAQFSEEELKNNEVVHPGNGLRKNLGQYLLRIGYHEAVHAGHFLSYLRQMGVERPQIWD